MARSSPVQKCLETILKSNHHDAKHAKRRKATPESRLCDSLLRASLRPLWLRGGAFQRASYCEQFASEIGSIVSGKVGRITIRGWGVGIRRRRWPLTTASLSTVAAVAPTSRSGDEERGLEAGRLFGGPRLARFVGAEPHADHVVGVDAGGGQRVERAEHAFVVAAKDDPVGDIRVGGDDSASGILCGERFAGVRHGVDIRFGHTRGERTAALALSVRSLQTESVWTSTERTPTFLALSSSQPLLTRSCPDPWR